VTGRVGDSKKELDTRSVTSGSGEVKRSEGSLRSQDMRDRNSRQHDLVLHSDVCLSRVEKELHHDAITEEGGEVERCVTIL
jgi:hypothetical protein